MANNTTENPDNVDSELPTLCSFKLTEAELPVILFISSLANFAAVITLLRLYRRLKSKNVMLITILAANDLCSSLSILLNNITNTLTCDTFKINFLCKLLGWIGIGSFGWSMFIISVISMERYLMVVYPFFHYTKVSKVKLVVAVAIGAFVSLLFTFLPLVGLGSSYIYYKDNRFCGFDWAASVPGFPVHTFYVEFLAVYGMCQVALTFFCNLSSMLHMRCKKKSVVPIRHQNVALGQRQTNRFALLTVAIAIINSVCSGPFFLKLMIDGVTQKQNIEGLEDSITSILLFCTPVINPILYLIFNRSYRELLFQPCPKWCRKTRVNPVPTAAEQRQNAKDSAGQVTINVTET